MKKHFFLTLAILLTALFASAQGYETTIPDEDHMSYFDLRGPVQEVRLYNYGGHSKTLWKFDKQGRLTHYEAYATPFAGNGGCVFGMTDRYRYAYDEEGKMIILETFNEVENLVDENDGKVLTLFPMREPKDVLFEQASKEYGDTTYCYSRWYEKEGDPLEHYHGRRYDKYGNWIEDFVGTEDSYSYTDTRVREIKYYKDIELMNLPMGVRSVINQWEADDKKWSNRYDFDKEGYLTHFRSWVKVDAYTPLEQLFEWDVKTDNTPGSDLIAVESGESREVKREVYFWSSVPVGELKFLPEGVNEKEAFYLCFDYMGYVFEGDIPTHADPSKPATAEYTYTFTGWTPNVVAVTGNATYTATYSSTKNTYTVTFVDYDGTELKVETVEYGQAATPPANPVRENYYFMGWDSDFSFVTEDMTVTATYKLYDPTDVDNISTSKPARKVMIDGQIFILRDGKTYTVTGQEVK